MSFYELDKDGTILDTSTYPGATYSHGKIYEKFNANHVKVIAYPDSKLTFKNATFNTHITSSSSINWSGYVQRNIEVERPNTEINGIKHYIKGLPSSKKIYYNYTGFIRVVDTADVTLKNCTFSAKNYTTQNGSYNSSYDFLSSLNDNFSKKLKTLFFNNGRH